MSARGESAALAPLMLFNSLTRTLEAFAPLVGIQARVYSCGPTVYNYPHIGNMRAYIFADTLGRVLRMKGFDLIHVINITDVGHLTDDGDAGKDKLEQAAIREQRSAQAIAAHFTQAYWADFAALACIQPAHWSIATDYVPQMIDFAARIADAHCYQLPSGLYFDTASVADYGRLARANTDAGESRIDRVDGKRQAADFAIWRCTPADESRQMEWDSPWGRGAPGWHLECSVMSAALLGLPFDIHTGGVDHREIHHPNEIAQNQAYRCTDDTGAKIWMHNNFLVDRTGKMSKSAGGFLRLQTLVDRGFHPAAYRLMCLQAHYRSELEFTWEGLAAALVRLKRIVRALAQPGTAGNNGDHDAQAAIYLSRFDEALSQDLNTPQALVVLEAVTGMPGVSPAWRRAVAAPMAAALGLQIDTLTPADLRIRPKTGTLTVADVEARLAQRQATRAAKDFVTADRIRDALVADGVDVMDGDLLGWDWRPDCRL